MHFSTLFAAFLLAGTSAFSQGSFNRIRLVSFNVDAVPKKQQLVGETRWTGKRCNVGVSESCRKPHVINQLKTIVETSCWIPSCEKRGPTIIALQGLPYKERKSFEKALGKNWESIAPFDPNFPQTVNDNTNPFFYNTKEFELQGVWAFRPSALAICTVAIFKDIVTGSRFIAANVDLNPFSASIREYEMTEMMRRVEDQYTMLASGVILLGSFHEQPDKGGHLTKFLEGKNMTDLAKHPNVRTQEDLFTYTSYGGGARERKDYTWTGYGLNYYMNATDFHAVSNKVEFKSKFNPLAMGETREMIISSHQAVVADFDVASTP